MLRLFRRLRRPSPRFDVKTHDILYSKSTRYSVLALHGQGCFGKVAKCVDLNTSSLVAIKIHCKRNKTYAREVKMLEIVRTLDPEKNNIVRFIEDFTDKRFLCLAFEMLDKSLWDMMRERKFKPLELNEIRPMIYQLLVALEALARIGIVHTDLKPGNVMFVNRKDNPFKLKLIDFGVALTVSQLKRASVIQPRAYRAPEVTLGLPLTAAVDMWSLGCLMIHLYFGMRFFGGQCAYQRMKAIVHMLGLPDDHLLHAGKNTSKYFRRENGPSGLRWRLNTPLEWKQLTGQMPHIKTKIFSLARNLEDAVQTFHKKRHPHEYEDRMEFLSFLKSCLDLDAGKRLTAFLALQHQFITMKHLIHEDSSYIQQAHKFMDQIRRKSDSSDTDTDELRHDQTANPSDGLSVTDNSIDEKSDPGAPTTDLKRAPCEDADAEICVGDVILHSDGTRIRVLLVNGLRDGVRGPVTPTTKGPVVVSCGANADAGCVSAVCNTHDDGAAVTVGSEDVGDVKKKTKRCRRIRKFFSSLKRRLMSVFKHHNN